MPALRPFVRTAAAVVCVLTVVACGKRDEPPARPPGILITATEVAAAPVETLEASVGQVESLVEPIVAAEVAGRVLAVKVEVGDSVKKGQTLVELDSEDYRLRQGSAQAEIGRLKALIAQQGRLVARYEALAKRDFFAKNAVDDARAQLQALQSQLASALAQEEEAQRNLQRGRVTAPIDGEVSARMVNEGAYVAVGMPVVRLSTDKLLRITLPFPEALSGVLKTGLPVRLRSPAAPGTVIDATISEIRPTVGTGNRALQVLVDLPNPGGWRPGASIDGEVILARREGALMVPEAAVVQRPAGPTVYVIEGDKARAAVVKTGVYRDGQIEISGNVKAGARIALDGAGFLGDGAVVRVQEAGT